MKSTYIWGAGHYGVLTALYCEQESVEVVGFIDSNASKIKTRLGLPVLEPNFLISIQSFVIIAVWDKKSVKEITEYLEKVGLKENDDFCYSKLINYAFCSEYCPNCPIAHKSSEQSKLNENIYVLGDSHSKFWKIQGDNFKIFHLGPVLAYNLNSYGTHTQCREKIDYLLKNEIQKKSLLMFALGEIDIRVHILKYGISQANERLNKVLENYMKFLDYILYEGYRIIVYGPIASQKDAWYIHPECPRFGNEVERNYITLLFNQQLENFCKSRNIGFITLFYDMIDENLRTKSQFIFDECHINNALNEEANYKLKLEILKMQIQLAGKVIPELECFESLFAIF